MLILGLHLGHDASITILKDGEIISCIELERISRIKHKIGIEADDILTCLKDANIKIRDIDFCTLTSTQDVQYLLSNKDRFNIALKTNKNHKFPCTLYDKLSVNSKMFYNSGKGWLQTLTEPIHKNHTYNKFINKDLKSSIKKNDYLGDFLNFIWCDLWENSLSSEKIRSMDLKNIINNPDFMYGFHYPCEVNIEGYNIASYIFSHHYAHAAHSFFTSNFNKSAIFTQDGGGNGHDYKSGIYCFAENNQISVIGMPHLNVGPFWIEIPNKIGLSKDAPGKMMGLAPYGEPIYFKNEFIGNYFDLKQKITPNFLFDNAKKNSKNYSGKFSSETLDKNSFARDIASSVQKYTEDNIQLGASNLQELLKNNNIFTDNLCLGGGVFLNCPSNSNLKRKNIFKNIFIPPNLHDGGLSCGSSLALYYCLMKNKRIINKDHSKKIYLGLNNSSKIENVEIALMKNNAKINYKNINTNIIEDCAKSLRENKIIGWFEGRSEIGPRALGHRSIFANPKFFDNWRKVNEIKMREIWRPFAPIVLEKFEDQYFDGLQQENFYMLFNSYVKIEKIPAITHIDKTARVQVVNEKNGLCYEMLECFYKLTGTPVLLNTSLNGPGEPIIEEPEQALNYLIESKLDKLYFDCGYVVTKKNN